MTNWSADELRHFGDAQEVRVAGLRPDGSLRSSVIVWIVRVGDNLYTRSVNGPGAAWFRGVQAHHQGQLSAGAWSLTSTSSSVPTPTTLSTGSTPANTSAIPGRSSPSPARRRGRRR